MGDTEEERAQAALVVEALSKTSDQDHVTLTMMPVSRGVRIRVELEQELLRLIGKASLMAGLGGPGAASILGGVASY